MVNSAITYPVVFSIISLNFAAQADLFIVQPGKNLN